MYLLSTAPRWEGKQAYSAGEHVEISFGRLGGERGGWNCWWSEFWCSPLARASHPGSVSFQSLVQAPSSQSELLGTVAMQAVFVLRIFSQPATHPGFGFGAETKAEVVAEAAYGGDRVGQQILVEHVKAAVSIGSLAKGQETLGGQGGPFQGLLDQFFEIDMFRLQPAQTGHQAAQRGQNL